MDGQQNDLAKGDFSESLQMARRAMRLCLPRPDRKMARPLFCAASIMLLMGKDASVPLGQMKLLLDRGIEHVAWLIPSLLRMLDSKLPPEQARLMRGISLAINDQSRLAELQADALWGSLKPVSFNTEWPV